MKYVILQPYFGKFPIWMDLFLYSCGKNSNIDFVFFTDCVPTIVQKSYPNVFFRQTTFEEYCKMVSLRLGIDFKPEYTYKLCDLKPFLGVVHQEIIDNYDYWGYCDIDVLLGDLSILLREMKEYDIISTHDDRLSGHFTMMKTKSKFTRACFKIWKWNEKLTMQKHKCLDETAFTIVVAWPMFCRDKFYQRYFMKSFPCIKGFYYKVTDAIIRLIQDNKVLFREYFTTPIPNASSQYIYDTKTGKVRDVIEDRELPYLHYLFFKKNQCLHSDDYWTEDFYHFHQGESFREIRKIEINKEGIYPISLFK